MYDTEQIDALLQKNNNNKSGFWKGLGVGVVITSSLMIVGIIAVVLIIDLFAMDADEVLANSDVITEEAIEKIGMITDTIDHYYIEDIDDAVLQEGIYSGILDSLGDPYSVYYTEEEVQDLMQSTDGTYYGIGAYIGMGTDTNLPTIARPIAGTPAEESGLLAGDVILEVDGIDIAGYSLEEVIDLVKGDEGTTVVLTIYREGTMDLLEIPIVRRQIETDTVAYEMMEDQIAYISIYEFDHVTVNQFSEALELAKVEGMEGLIFDLRGNPGGNVDTVVDILRMILPEGIIVYTEDKYGERVEYTGSGEDPLTIPIVVLVDSSSASAAEIMASALRDYNMATLIGTTTYGKGIVQNIIMLSDGTALKITSSTYYTLSGTNIHGVGLEPDVEVPFDASSYIDEGIDNQLDAAVEYLQSQL
ncbi:MAG: S41 family peptidase [Eubacteriales bacterium]